MARGAQAKIEVVEKILQTFNGSFQYNGGKELRIPMMEDGQEVQIKVTLTCAKDNVVPGQENALPGTVNTTVGTDNNNYNFGKAENATVEIKPVEPTAEEKANVKSLLEYFGL